MQSFPVSEPLSSWLFEFEGKYLFKEKVYHDRDWFLRRLSIFDMRYELQSDLQNVLDYWSRWTHIYTVAIQYTDKRAYKTERKKEGT